MDVRFARHSQYVQSFDGTRLAVDVFVPTGSGAGRPARLPAVFVQMRSPLLSGTAPGRPAPVPFPVAHVPEMLRPYVEAGYALVLQDRRGEGASFGVQHGFVTRDDARDAAAVIEWAAAQAWSNGRLGAIGCSNQGSFQLPLAAERPPHLVSIAPECASPFFFDTMIAPNGVSSLVLGERPPYDGRCGESAPPELGYPVAEDKAPAYRLARAAAAEHRCNATFLGQYWAQMHRDSVLPALAYRPGIDDTVMHRADRVRESQVKILQVGGWFDASPGGQLQAWQVLGGHVLIGPWAHCETSEPGGGFRNASGDRAALMIRWLDATLKGIDNGMLTEPSIRYYTMNARPGREWGMAPAWPLPGVSRASFYLQAGRTGSIASVNDGLLSRGPPDGVAKGEDSIHPDDAISLFDGEYVSLRRFWAGDMAPTDQRGLTYTTDGAGQDMQVTGHPVLDLWISSSATDEDFFAVLEDVRADGHSTYVTHGQSRASQRRLATPLWGDLGTPWHSQAQADDEPLTPGQPVELYFDMTPTSWVFRAGHRIRLSIFNAGGRSFQPPWAARTGQVRSVNVYRGGTHASHLQLPVVLADSPFYAGEPADETAGRPADANGRLASGALWAAQTPPHWNGTLLLYSHGYSPDVRDPQLAPRGMAERLLAEGYALAASSYSAAGWAVAEAVPDQIETRFAFARQFGEPNRTIVWGDSMGGLVSVAMAEYGVPGIDAALSACGSIGGSLGMMNQALDGAFAFRTLLGGNAPIQLQHVTDDRVNGQLVQGLATKALETPSGRARLGLSAVLAGLPDWSKPDSDPPDSDRAVLEQLAASFAFGAMLPRSDQERRAGGAFSWNTGVDYSRQLRDSGRERWVRALYDAAGLDLAADLRRLANAPRESAQPEAVAYMRAHYVPSGEPRVPVLSLHTLGDGMTVPAMQEAYGLAVAAAGRSQWYRYGWVRGAGHCAFRPGEYVAALHALEWKLDRGTWLASPADLNGFADGKDGTPTRFVSADVGPFLRPCAKPGQCAGEPR